MGHSIPDNFYSCDQVRELDRRIIQEQGISGIQLMKKAARSAFYHALATWEGAHDWLVLCGGGNNGGDGYIFAALAAQKKHRVAVFAVVDPASLKDDALRAYQFALQEGVQLQPFSVDGAKAALSENTIIVDALLGTGVRGPVRDPFVAAIQWINQSGRRTVSLDIPSGLCGDTGIALGEAVNASLTVTFIAIKAGLLTHQGPRFCGQLRCADLDADPAIVNALEPVARAPQRSALRARLPQRLPDAHKGAFGHVMIIGGDHGYGGAALLACESAAVSGAGLTSVATRPEHVTAVLIRRPEVMVIGIDSGQALEPHLTRPDVLVVGPGLGQTAWSEQVLQQALLSRLPMVLDADALNILAGGRLSLPAGADCVLTPHPGEAARLLGCSVAEVQADRFTAVRALQSRYGGVIILKGAGSLICDGKTVVLASVGNAGLARGGTGDLLSGLIGGLMAQGVSAFEAAQLAVCIHGDAAVAAAPETGLSGMLASELVPYIRRLLSE